MSTVAPAKLDATFAGELIDPDHPGYDAARQVFNGVFDKRPALIARCTSPADVQIALAHAREQDLVVAVRGGGIPSRDTPRATAGWSSTPAR